MRCFFAASSWVFCALSSANIYMRFTKYKVHAFQQQHNRQHFVRNDIFARGSHVKFLCFITEYIQIRGDLSILIWFYRDF